MSRDWKIHVTAESKKLPLKVATIRSIARSILELVTHEIAPQSVNELHIFLINDARMREINFEHRGKDKTTDVLSFPQFEPGQLSGEKPLGLASGSYLGDLVISTETTISQAKRFKVTTRQELIRLMTHGILHLIGYDHEKVPPAKAQRMRRRERQIRAAL